MLENKVLETIKKYNLIEKGDKIIVGVSGGPDSICLVDILNRYKEDLEIEIIIVHINHMIRDDAQDDEEYVRKYSRERKIPFFSKQVDVENIAKSKKMGIEEAGRYERYEYFKEVLSNTRGNKIATAHNKNDNAESVLMNIIRGTGSAGLKGIEASRDDVYIKPLIEASRGEIEEYCSTQKLNPRYDKTNKDNSYTRNRIRNTLIPFMEIGFNPNIIDTLNRLSETMTNENDYLDEITENTYNEILIKEEKEEIILDLKEFNKKHKTIKSRIIFICIKKLLGSTNRYKSNSYK